ncbi:hypothetical protein [Pseudomonas sp. 22 E 5]|nr:hypothetical protein [Pseudomonas sp. 22 E 5]
MQAIFQECFNQEGSRTRRMAVAAYNDQKPPMATPISARPTMNTQ